MRDDIEEKRKLKMRSDDRLLVLEKIPNQKTKSSTGLVDPRLFNGENRLHIIKDPQMSIWTFKYDSGGVPEPLKEKYTSFALAYAQAESYLKTRGIRIARVED